MLARRLAQSGIVARADGAAAPELRSVPARASSAARAICGAGTVSSSPPKPGASTPTGSPAGSGSSRITREIEELRPAVQRAKDAFAAARRRSGSGRFGRGERAERASQRPPRSRGSAVVARRRRARARPARAPARGARRGRGPDPHRPRGSRVSHRRGARPRSPQLAAADRRRAAARRASRSRSPPIVASLAECAAALDGLDREAQHRANRRSGHRRRARRVARRGDRRPKPRSPSSAGARARPTTERAALAMRPAELAALKRALGAAIDEAAGRAQPGR